VHDEIDVGHIVSIDGRVETDPDDLGIADSGRDVVLEHEASGREIARHDVGQTRLGDRRLAESKPIDGRRVRIEAADTMPYIRRTGRGYRAEVPEAEDADVHARESSSQWLAWR
jgi:hypothetical protein